MQDIVLFPTVLLLRGLVYIFELCYDFDWRVIYVCTCLQYGSNTLIECACYDTEQVCKEI